MKPFKSYKNKYRSPDKKDKLSLLDQEIMNLQIRNRSENDVDVSTRIEELKSERGKLVAKYSQMVD